MKSRWLFRCSALAVFAPLLALGTTAFRPAVAFDAPQTHGIALDLLLQQDAPAMLAQATFGMKELFQKGELSTGSQPIARYQIGWVTVRSHGPSKIQLGKWVQPQTLLPAHAASEIPNLHIPARTVFQAGVVKVAFFVAAVAFSDGKIWRADEKSILQAAQ